RAVGRLLEDVAREGAQAAGVDGQRLVDGVLRAEERDGVLGRDRAADVARRAGEVRAHELLEALRLGKDSLVGGRALQRVVRRLLQEADRVAAAQAPAARVDAAEEVGAPGRPGPAVVVG